MESVEEKSFAKCISLETLNLGAGIERIGTYAFQGCTALTSLSIPSNVTTLENYAFYKCSAIEEVNFETTTESVEGETVVKGVASIGDYAFYNVVAPTELHLPVTVKSVGKYAFKGWANLKSLTLSKTIKNIGGHAFYGSREMTIYTDAKEDEVAWDARWNSLYRPVVWGCTLSDDVNERYVVSLVLEANSVSNISAKNGIGDPERVGKVFAGWSATIDGETLLYTTAQFAEIPVGTHLTALWEDAPVVEEPEEEGNGESEQDPEGENPEGDGSGEQVPEGENTEENGSQA
jgi:hypothetical protein